MLSLLRAFLWLEIKLARQHRTAVFMQLIQFMVFLFVFSRLPLDNRDSFTGGIPYVQYVLTGFVFQIFYEAIMNGPTGRLSELQMTGQLQVVLSAPYPRWMILFASGFGSMLNGVFRSLLVFVAGVLLFDLNIHVFSLAALIGALVYTFSLCTSLALLNVAGALLWPRLNLTSIFSSLLLGLLSGVFIPIDQLPKLIRPIALVNPLRWGLDVFRYSLGQHSVVSGEGWVYSLGAVVIFAFLSAGLYRRADHALTRDNRYQNF